MIIRHSSLLGSFITAVVVFAVTPLARAETHMYLKFDAATGPILGQVVRSGYEGAIEILSFNFGAGRGVSITHGAGGLVELSGPQISDFTITAPFDSKAFTTLLKQSLIGEAGKIGKLTSVAGGAENSFASLTIDLEGVISAFSSSQSAGDDGGGFMSISFTLTKFKVKTSTPNNQGGVDEGTPFTWDVIALHGD